MMVIMMMMIIIIIIVYCKSFWSAIQYVNCIVLMMAVEFAAPVQHHSAIIY